MALFNETVYNSYDSDYTTIEMKSQVDFVDAFGIGGGIEQLCRFYCPCCGEQSEVELDLVLCPGSIEFVICPECGTMFKVTIQYTEVRNGLE